MTTINTVLGAIPAEHIGKTLIHEKIAQDTPLFSDGEECASDKDGHYPVQLSDFPSWINTFTN